MDSSQISMLVLFIILIGLSAFYSSAETAFMSVSKIRIKTRAEDDSDPKKARAQIVDELLQDSDKLLSTILVGNNIVNTAASALTTSFVISFLGNQGIGVAIATGVVTLVILVFGEITPKTMASNSAESISLATCKILRANRLLFTPAVVLLTAISRGIIKLLGDQKDQGPTMTEDDLKTIVNVSHEEGVLEDEEKEMLHNVFEFGDTEIREIMTPRIKVTFVEDDVTYDELMNVLRINQFSRIPVHSDDLDRFIGVLNVKDLLMALGVDRENFRIKSYMRQPFFVYEFNPINDVFAKMRKEHVSLAIVLDEYGIMSGIVSMEDIVEEIVGEIDDEYDEDSSKVIHEIGDHKYILDGSVDIDEVNETCGTNFVTEDFESIGGLVLGEVNGTPQAGEKVTIDHCEFTIRKVANNRITELVLEIQQEKDEE